MANVTEQEMALALAGKFFRGPSTFHQTIIGIPDDDDYLEPPEKMIALPPPPASASEPTGPAKWRVPVSMCVDAICHAHSMTPKELMEMRRTKRLVVARQHAAWLIKRLRPEVSTTQIADRLRYNDHTTVVHGIQRFEKIKPGYMPEVAKALDYVRATTGDQTICL